MGEYFQQEIEGKLGVSVYLRMDPETLPKVRMNKSLSYWKQFTNGFKGWESGRYANFNACDMLCRFGGIKRIEDQCDKTLPEGNLPSNKFDFDIKSIAELTGPLG